MSNNPKYPGHFLDIRPTTVLRSAAVAIAFVPWLVACADNECSGPCGITGHQLTLLQVEGYAIVRVESDCRAVQTPMIPGMMGPPRVVIFSAAIEGGAPTAPTVCHATVTLDNGAEIPIVVDANIGVEGHCCKKGTILYTASFQTIVIKAPPGYVPDAGSDAASDATNG